MKALFLFLLSTSCFARPLFVVIDPGHGGEDVGAIHKTSERTLTEKDITLAFAKATAEEFKKLGVNPVLTRNKDEVVLLDRRTAIAQATSKKGKTVFLSLHVNSSTDASAQGMETYIFDATTNEASHRLADIENGSHRVSQKGMLSLIFADLNATANFSESVNLACEVHSRVALGLSTKWSDFKDRGIKKGLFYVLLDSGVPSLLVELGFISHLTESQRLQEKEYLTSYAKLLSSSVAKWMRKGTTVNRLALSGISKGSICSDKKEPSRYK